MRTTSSFSCTVAATALLLAAGCDARQSAAAGSAPTAVAATAPAPASDVFKVPLGDSPGRGAASPKVTVVAFSEFQCPFCGKVVPTLEQLLGSYGNDVRLVFKHRPLEFHQNALPAALAAEAAGEQGKFWEMHDRLFKNQQALGPAELEEHARAVGLDLPRWRAALASVAVKGRVDADRKLADDLGVEGTPTFFINGKRLVGAQPLARFKAAIDEELARADARMGAGVSRASLYADLTGGGAERAAQPLQAAGGKAAAVQKDGTNCGCPKGAPEQK